MQCYSALLLVKIMAGAGKRKITFGDRTLPIELEYSNGKVYSKCKNYDVAPHNFKWHEFKIHHNGQLEYLQNAKQTILDALFDAIDGNELYPVAYEHGKRCDTFYARACKHAIDKLFALGLSISTANGATLPMSVQFNVANFKNGQISPFMLIAQAVGNRMCNLESHEGVRGILNLANFGKDDVYFGKVEVRLSNLFTLDFVCRSIHENQTGFRSLKGLILACNNIRNPTPLSIFADANFEVLDLSDNRISSAPRLCQALAGFKVTELRLANNPLIKNAKYPEVLKPLEKNVKVVDGAPFENLFKDYTPLEFDVDSSKNGVRIDWTNKLLLDNFRSSPNWHGFFIPDDSRPEIPKDVLFDYFFISVNPILSQFYPCYYKYDQGEHCFLVRNCFDQIEHLVNICNMQLKIPELTSTDENGVPHITFDRTLPFYLRMNMSNFQKGQVDSKKSIQFAIDKRFSVLDRILNLNHFQQTEGLENIVINMSTAKIVMDVLTIASSKVLGNCAELNLSQNKIMNLNLETCPSLFTGLHALDLGNNWIHNLSDINSLGMVPLKSLILHGNPLCRNYALPSDYVNAVKAIFPLLTKLDGVELKTNPGVALQKNFLVCTDGYELAGELFLDRYLRQFESTEDRFNLIGLYTDNSLFTMTCSYETTNLALPMFKRIARFSTHARNLLKLTDHSRAINGIYIGAAEIHEIMMKLPEVKHDFVSLHTDVMHYDKKSAIINVSGVLRDESQEDNATQLSFYLAFSRQFVLKFEEIETVTGGRATRVKITNDRFNIMKPTSKQLKTAFTFTPYDPNKTLAVDDDTANSDIQLHKLVLFQEVTGLRGVWAERCLQDANWSFEGALREFVQLAENNALGDSAFE